MWHAYKYKVKWSSYSITKIIVIDDNYPRYMNDVSHISLKIRLMDFSYLRLNSDVIIFDLFSYFVNNNL